MLKGLLLQSGRLLLAGAFGMKRAEEFPPLVRCLCCFYPLIWLISFIGFGTDSEWIAWLLSIGMPVLYIIFVIFVRLKNEKIQIVSEIEDSEEKTEEHSSEEPEETTVIIEPIKKEQEEKKPTEKLHKKRSTIPYIVSIVILSVALVASLSACFVTVNQNNQKSIQIEELQKKSEELVSEYADAEKEIDHLTRKVATREEKISNINKENSDLAYQLFYYKIYTCVVNNGSNYYHQFGCDKLNTSKFYVYSINEAERKGYTACPDCYGLF